MAPRRGGGGGGSSGGDSSSSSGSNSNSNSNGSSSNGSGSNGSGSSGIDYSPPFHTEAAAGAIVFSVFYGIMLLYYIHRARGNSTSVFISLMLFCAIRLTGFGMRVAIDGMDGIPAVGLVIAWWILYDVGIFALLYATHALVLNRAIMSGNVVKNPIFRIISNKHLIRFTLGAAVALGIACWAGYSQGLDVTIVVILQKVSAIIFLAVTVMLAVQTIFQVQGERTALGPGKSSATYIPYLIVVLLLIRGIYATFTAFSSDPQTQAVWYSLAAAPELLAVFLFAVPNLVPQKKDLVLRAHQHEKGSGVIG